MSICLTVIQTYRKKIIVDTYGFGSHGVSEKAAYMARWLAKNIVAE